MKHFKFGIFSWLIENELKPRNPETDEEFEFQEFIEYIKDKYDIIIKPDKKGNCEYSIFESIILFLDINMSDRILNYKKIYSEAMSIMINSQKEIIYYINEVNNKKRNLPEFLDTFIRNHLINYRRPFTLEKAFESLNKK